MHLPAFGEPENDRFRQTKNGGSAAHGKMFERFAANRAKDGCRLPRTDPNDGGFVRFNQNFRALAGFHFSKKDLISARIYDKIHESFNSSHAVFRLSAIR